MATSVHPGAHRTRTAALAAVNGTTIASLYYCQPVLASLGRSFGVPTGTAGLVVVASLVGNALGQLFVVPLADLRERRRLAQCVLAVQLVGLAGMAVAPSLAVAVACGAVIGLGSSAAMVVVPYAAGLATSAERGRVTGTVMSGMLLGILFSRSLSGFLSAGLGWRATYVLAAVLGVAAIAVLGRMPAARADEPAPSYPRLLASVAAIVRGDRRVRRHMLLGMAGFTTFNLFWTGLTLLLSGPSYRLGDAAIGLFGLLGAAGALTAQRAGRWHDAGHGPRVRRLGWTAIALAWAVLTLAGSGSTTGMVAVIAGIALLDVGMQAQHISNQSALLAAHPNATARVTTAYMGGNVLAAALGSALASGLYPAVGWTALPLTGLATVAVALPALRNNTRTAHRDT